MFLCSDVHTRMTGFESHACICAGSTCRGVVVVEAEEEEVEVEETGLRSGSSLGGMMVSSDIDFDKAVK